MGGPNWGGQPQTDPSSLSRTALGARAPPRLHSLSRFEDVDFLAGENPVPLWFPLGTLESVPPCTVGERARGQASLRSHSEVADMGAIEPGCIYPET